MRAGVSSVQVTSADQVTTGVIASDEILNDSIVNADVNSAAGIAYTKLNVNDSIVNADVKTTAAIVYSKLSLADSVVNADIKTTAAIASTKLDLSAVAQDIVPDANATRYCGTGAKAWLSGYFSLADVGYFLNSIEPNVTGTQVIGSAGKIWKEIYTNDIQGAARNLIMTFGLLGG